MLDFTPLPPDRRRRERALLVSAVVLPALILVLGGFLQRWVGDDGFINVRVANQLLAGNGFVFNAGERSEAVTSPLWVLILSGAGLLGVRLDDAAWLLGLALTVLGVVASGLAGLLRCETRTGHAPVILPFGLLFYACLPPAWDYATSGLENGLGVAFLGLSHWLVARAVTMSPCPRRTYLAAFVLGTAAIVRPDYALLALPLLGYLCWLSQGAWRRLGVAAAGVGVGATYQLFRMGYFAALVPNTALAKEAFEPRWAQGLRYFWNSAGLYWLLVPIAGVLGLLGVQWLTRRRSASVALGPLLATAGVLHLLYVVRVGGDFMHARLLLPGLFYLFSAAPFLDLGELWGRRKPLVALATLGALAYGWCFLCATQLRVAKGNEFGIGDERGWHARLARVRNPTRLEHYKRFAFHRAATKTKRQLTKLCPSLGSPRGRARPTQKHCTQVLIPRRGDGALKGKPRAATLPLDARSVPPDIAAVVAQRPLGIASNVLGLRVNVVDYFGLADPFASRLVVGKRHRPGHEKAFDTRWLSARYAAPGATQDPRVLVAKRALACGELAELARATRGPLDFRGFVRNLGNAFRFHGLRIPKSPRAAEKAFCTRSR